MRIKECREAVGMTQQQVADRLGISRQQWASREGGGVALTEGDLRSMAYILRCKIADLFESPGSMFLGDLENRDRAIVDEVLGKLADHNQEKFQEILREHKRELTISEYTMFSIVTEKKTSINDLLKWIDEIADQVSLLEMLGVPVSTAIEKLTPAQQEAFDASKPYLEKINAFKEMWRKANAG